MAKPLIIENSFITLHTEQVDGIAQTTGNIFIHNPIHHYRYQNKPISITINSKHHSLLNINPN